MHDGFCFFGCLDIICSEMRKVSEWSSRKSESLEQQMMFKDKYTGIFLRQIEAIVFVFLQLFLQRVGKVFTNSSPFIT